MGRKALNDYVVEGHSNYVIEKGMPVLIPISAIHLDSEFYENPHQFNPDNFLPELVEKRHPLALLAFGEGPRNCIGMRFGKMQARLGLAMLINSFKFSICEKTEVPINIDKKNFIYSSKGGIYLKVEKL